QRRQRRHRGGPAHRDRRLCRRGSGGHGRDGRKECQRREHAGTAKSSLHRPVSFRACFVLQAGPLRRKGWVTAVNGLPVTESNWVIVAATQTLNLSDFALAFWQGSRPIANSPLAKLPKLASPRQPNPAPGNDPSQLNCSGVASPVV